MRLVKAVIFIILVSFWFSKSQAQAQIPFVYLNQYFNFEAINSHEILISNTKFDFDDWKVNVSKGSVQMDISAIKNFKYENAYFLIKESGAKSKSIKMPISKNKFLYSFSKNSKYALVCLNQASHFTKIEMCKNLTKLNNLSSKTEFNPEVKIDGMTFDKVGIVVLKDNQESVSFEAKLSEENYLSLLTKKRRIFPRKIEKEALEDFLAIQFVDISLNKNNAWDEKLNLDQTYFEIALDPLLKMKQDIFFKNDKLKANSFNYVYTETKKIKQPMIYDNDTTAELFGIYLGLSGQSSLLKVSLNSDLGKGFRLSQKRIINKWMDAHFGGTLIQTSIVLDSNNLIYNPNQFLYSLNAGINYHFKNKFDLLSEVQIKKDLFFKRHDTTTNAIDIIAGLNKEFSVTPSWAFFQDTDALASVDIGFHYFLATTAEQEAINSGYSYQVGLNYIYKLDMGNLRFHTHYSKRSQNTENFSFFEQTAYYGLGYQYLF